MDKLLSIGFVGAVDDADEDDGALAGEQHVIHELIEDGEEIAISCLRKDSLGSFSGQDFTWFAESGLDADAALQKIPHLAEWLQTEFGRASSILDHSSQWNEQNALPSQSPVVSFNWPKGGSLKSRPTRHFSQESDYKASLSKSAELFHAGIFIVKSDANRLSLLVFIKT